jgi:16S rRNA (cytosine967-C5)-methyltransferase
MTPAARTKALEELMIKITDARIPMDAVTGDYFRFRKYIGSKDRAAVAQDVYTLMRHYGRLKWWIDFLGVSDTPRVFTLLYFALVHGRDADWFDHHYTGEKYTPAPLTPDEHKMLGPLYGAGLHHPKMPDTIRVECPEKYADSCRAVYKNDLIPEMTAMLEPAPLDVRVNLLSADRDAVIRELQDSGITCQKTPYSPWGIRLFEKAFLSETKAFRDGRIEIQDEGSQLIAYICGAVPGRQVLDYCAGAGGKTLALSSAMRNKGRIVAMDTEKSRLEKGRLRFRRAGAHDIIEIRPLSDERHRKWLRRQKGTFDVVLTDVPCSGTGTWRRNPDMRWRTFGPDLAELTAIQTDILEKVAGTVKPGGRLVYATCSLLPDENEHQVERFLAAHPDFTLRPLADIWPDETPCPCPSSPYMRLSPHQNQTDGFFAAVLERTGAP